MYKFSSQILLVLKYLFSNIFWFLTDLQSPLDPTPPDFLIVLFNYLLFLYVVVAALVYIYFLTCFFLAFLAKDYVRIGECAVVELLLLFDILLTRLYLCRFYVVYNMSNVGPQFNSTKFF